MPDELEEFFAMVPGARGPQPAAVPSSSFTDDPPEAFFDALREQEPLPLSECHAPTFPLTSEACEPYIPMDPVLVHTITLSMARRLNEQGPFDLRIITPFRGHGIYGIYYQGDNTVYQALVSMGSLCPLYIGAAAQDANSSSLYTRLEDRRNDLTHLGLENFTVRFLCLPPHLVKFTEHNLIELYQPVWNTYLRGFGARGGARDGSGRSLHAVSLWDTIHPGRPTVRATPRDRTSVERRLVAAVRASRRAYDEVAGLLATGTEV